MAPHIELPLDLRNHLCGCSAVFLRVCPLFSNKSGCTCVGLGVYGLAIPLVLFSDLHLVRRYSHPPLGKREDSSFAPTHHDKRSNYGGRIW